MKMKRRTRKTLKSPSTPIAPAPMTGHVIEGVAGGGVNIYVWDAIAGASKFPIRVAVGERAVLVDRCLAIRPIEKTL